MDSEQYSTIVSQLGYTRCHRVEILQTLWGGYGELVRLFVDDTSIIIKHIQLPKPEQHPRGWNTDLSHQRKLKSYHVELAWYQHYAASSVAVTPRPIKVTQAEAQWQLVMQDLRTLGYTEVETVASKQHISACLRWLATFHAQFIGGSHHQLWETGTYWHLDTRPDEWSALTDGVLKEAATKIDSILRTAPYQTLVHGDAKLANFCFTEQGESAAAVDFQYVGRGCAMKDVALFMSSAVDPEACHDMEAWLLEDYFRHLRLALAQLRPELNADDVERVWRPLFAIAWADFQRFVKGWSPDHWKINPYTEGLTQRALQTIGEDCY